MAPTNSMGISATTRSVAVQRSTSSSAAATGTDLNGNAGNDMLDGGTAADDMTGGAGDDTYFVDDAGDVVIESGAGGADLVFTSVSYSLSDDVERIGVNGFTTTFAIAHRQRARQRAVRQ